MECQLVKQREWDTKNNYSNTTQLVSPDFSRIWILDKSINARCEAAPAENKVAENQEGEIMYTKETA